MEYLFAFACVFACACTVRFPGGPVIAFLWRLAATTFWVIFIEGLAILI